MVKSDPREFCNIEAVGAKRGQKKIPELPKRHLYVIYRKMKKKNSTEISALWSPKVHKMVSKIFFSKKNFFSNAF